MSRDNFEIICKTIQAGRIDDMEKKLLKLLMVAQITPDEYQQAFEMVKKKREN